MTKPLHARLNVSTVPFTISDPAELFCLSSILQMSLLCKNAIPVYQRD